MRLPYKNIAVVISTVLLYLCLYGCGAPDSREGHAEHEEHADHDAHAEEGHEGRDHDAHTDEGAEKEDEGHDHDAHADEGHEGHDDHGTEEETKVVLSSRAKDLAGITIGKVEKIRIEKNIELSGEIGFNKDKLVHVTPRFSGIARDVRKYLGDYVEAGETIAVIEGNESFSHYEVKAPLEGRIIEKHIVAGEFVGEGDIIYKIANMAMVWVNCMVYPNDRPFVKRGQKVTVKTINNEFIAKGTISYIAPVINKTTRSAVARVVISSRGGKWGPGMFIKCVVETAAGKAVPAVIRDAVQTLDENQVLFVPEGETGYKPVRITVGKGNKRYLEILSGPQPGDRYVVTGAFDLKAKIITSSLSGHAGHGH